MFTCRTDEFKAAIGAFGDKELLHGVAVVELKPLDLASDTVRIWDHLSTGGLDHDWDPVKPALAAPTPLRAALNSPLYVWLAGEVYNHSRTTRREKPEELCRFAGREAVEHHLIKRFVADALSKDPPFRDRATVWFRFLAGKLGNDPFEWWSLDDLAPRELVPAAVTVICGLATGVSAYLGQSAGVGIGLGFGLGMLAALVIGLGFRQLAVSGKTEGRALAGRGAGPPGTGWQAPWPGQFSVPCSPVRPASSDLAMTGRC